ncbi:hypothetical protein JEM67_20905 [Serratia sp. PAMC26656]|uniref:hypothetical protein n=1 Tax=Serratia sp. PAMC26656 TaxID=2775909 RepID=UPI0018F40452|nr:hypothetical protein [Serratia sp. PAMC26656]MBJ7892229.1 hypothetical protein [Serratia sp. PAMC26656]
MTKSATEFTPTHEDKTQEALARYHAKLETLRSVLIECAPRDGKDILESVAENISAAFDKIKL